MQSVKKHMPAILVVAVSLIAVTCAVCRLVFSKD